MIPPVWFEGKTSLICWDAIEPEAKYTFCFYDRKGTARTVAIAKDNFFTSEHLSGYLPRDEGNSIPFQRVLVNA